MRGWCQYSCSTSTLLLTRACEPQHRRQEQRQREPPGDPAPIISLAAS